MPYQRKKYFFHLVVWLGIVVLFFLCPVHATPLEKVPAHPAAEQDQDLIQPFTPQENVHEPRPLQQYTSQEQAFIDTRPVIKVANEFDWPPFDFIADGKPAGFGIELMELLARKSGLSITYVNGYTWDELLEMFLEGRLDVVHSLSLTPERQEKAFFSSPYYHSKNILIYRSDTLDIHTLDDLEGKIIALPRGWSSIEFFKTHFPKVYIIEVDSSRQALEYVDQGKVAATVEQEGIARYFIKKFGFTNLELSGWLENEELQKTSSMHFAVLRTNPLVFSILEKALSSVTPAEMERLTEKWFSRSGQQIGSDDVGLTPEERRWLAGKKQITFTLDPVRMPFSSIQGNQAAGMVSDLLDIFSERLGIPFLLKPAPSFEEALNQVKTGQCDMILPVSKTPGRSTVLEFTSAFMNYNVVIISRNNFPFISDIPELVAKKIGIIANRNLFEKVVNIYPELNYILYETIEKCLVEVSSGQLDAAILSLPVASHYIRKTGITNLKVAGHSSIKEDLRIGVQKEDKHLHSIMSKVVRSLTLQDIDMIYQKWVGSELTPRTDYSLLWKALSIAGIILVIVVAWNRNLTRLNRQIALAHETLREKTRELEHISITDSLTKIFNRRHIEAVFDLEIKRTLRHHRDLSIVLVDIDFFKAVNDTFGHQTGDRVLEQFADLIKTNIRTTDILGRWGGEEFLIVCPETNLTNAAHLAKTLCRRIETAQFDRVGPQTASFGATGFKQGDDSQTIIFRADKALYLAKSQGRNRVEIVT